MWVVIYAKMTDDKENGVRLSGVHFGGAADDKAGADAIARECVNSVKGGTIMPRLYQSTLPQELLMIMQDAEQVFKKKEQEMILAAQIISRPAKRK